MAKLKFQRVNKDAPCVCGATKGCYRYLSTLKKRFACMNGHCPPGYRKIGRSESASPPCDIIEEIDAKTGSSGRSDSNDKQLTEYEAKAPTFTLAKARPWSKRLGGRIVVSPGSLQRLECFELNGKLHYPERNSYCRRIGIGNRRKDGSKGMVASSKRGIYTRLDRPVAIDIALFLEGFSCVATVETQFADDHSIFPVGVPSKGDNKHAMEF